jgi:hypothetical protein
MTPGGGAGARRQGGAHGGAGAAAAAPEAERPAPPGRAEEARGKGAGAYGALPLLASPGAPRRAAPAGRSDGAGGKRRKMPRATCIQLANAELAVRLQDECEQLQAQCEKWVKRLRARVSRAEKREERSQPFARIKPLKHVRSPGSKPGLGYEPGLGHARGHVRVSEYDDDETVLANLVDKLEAVLWYEHSSPGSPSPMRGLIESEPEAMQRSNEEFALRLLGTLRPYDVRNKLTISRDSFRESLQLKGIFLTPEETDRVLRAVNNARGSARDLNVAAEAGKRDKRGGGGGGRGRVGRSSGGGGGSSNNEDEDRRGKARRTSVHYLQLVGTLERRTEASRKLLGATKVQSVVRGFFVRQVARRRRAAAVRIQSLMRALRVRRAFRRTKRAAVTIETQGRAYAERARYRRARQAAVAIEAQGRAFIQRLRFRELKESAQVVQRATRAYIGRQGGLDVERQLFLAKKAAAVAIQSVARGYLARCGAAARRGTARHDVAERVSSRAIKLGVCNAVDRIEASQRRALAERLSSQVIAAALARAARP